MCKICENKVVRRYGYEKQYAPMSKQLLKEGYAWVMRHNCNEIVFYNKNNKPVFMVKNSELMTFYIDVPTGLFELKDYGDLYDLAILAEKIFTTYSTEELGKRLNDRTSSEYYGKSVFISHSKKLEDCLPEIFKN